MMEPMNARAYIQNAIETEAFVRSEERDIVQKGDIKQDGWIFDIRKTSMKRVFLNAVGTLFWDTFKERHVQIGGLETAAISLASACIMSSPRAYQTGFFIRKSRKKDGLMQMIEGSLQHGTDIVLVDDIVNSGKSLIRQVEILEGLGFRVAAVWTIMRFRDLDFYEYFKKRGIEMYSLFTLDDFESALGVRNLDTKNETPTVQPYHMLWKFASPTPSYHHAVPKSDIALDSERAYMGSDIGAMWAIDQETGSVVWSYRIGFHTKRKGIFSSPAVHDGIVYFGGYDGNFYALDAQTGARKWVSLDADWIGSSPALAPDLGIVFVGLEFGLWRKRGGISAINMKTGKMMWSYTDMPCFTHSSPFYIREHKQVVIGSNDGAVYLFEARTGKLLWKRSVRTLTETELNSGFSAVDIKESFAYDPKRDHIYFGNKTGDLFAVNRRNGLIAHTLKAEAGFYSTPVIYGNTLLASCLDKFLYCVNLDTFEVKWKWFGGARIFASPVVIDGSIYIGANTGRLTELNPETGTERSYIALTERITNRPAYNPTTGRFFVSTFANEIYCFERTDKTRDTAKAQGTPT